MTAAIRSVDVEHGVGHVPGQRLEQGEGAGARDGGGHRVGHGAVVDGVGQGVGHAGRSQVDRQVEVDLEGLGPLLLLGQDAVGAHAAQAAQLDPVARGPGRGHHGRLGAPAAGSAARPAASWPA